MKILFLLQILLFFSILNINSTPFWKTKKPVPTTKTQKKESTFQQKIKHFFLKEQSVDTQIDDDQKKLKLTVKKIDILNEEKSINKNEIQKDQNKLKKIRKEINSLEGESISDSQKELEKLRKNADELELEIKAKTEILEQSKKGHPLEQQKGELEKEKGELKQRVKELEEKEERDKDRKAQIKAAEAGSSSGGEKGGFFTKAKETITGHVTETIGIAAGTAVFGLVTTGGLAGGAAGIASATSDDKEGSEGGAEYEEYIDDIEVDIGVYETVPRLRKKISSGLAAGTNYLNDAEE